MNLTQAAVAAALLALTTAPSWAVNKCTGPDGRVQFQDAPCTGTGEAITVRPASGNASASSEQSAERTRREIARINRRSEVTAAIGRGEPLVGMSRAELGQAMGAPTCRVPDHCIDSKRYPLFMAREVMAGVIEQLSASRSKPA
jgi:hypothetical protein